MINKIDVAFVGLIDSKISFKDKFEKTYYLSSLEELKDFLIENTVDLIVYGSLIERSEIQLKIFTKYNVPALSLNKKNKNDEFILSYCLEKDLHQESQRLLNQIISFRNFRENKKYKKIIENLKRFTEQVIHTTKDLFIVETKNYFNAVFKLNRCYWAQVKDDSLKLPPILKLRQELETQKVDQSSLIAELDQCQSEVVHDDNFQIWKTQKGHYLALLWIAGPTKVKQCIILSDLKTLRLDEVKAIISATMPFLMRRWSLCLTVETISKEIYKDSLTDLYNQKFLNEVLDKKIEECTRYKTPFSILFIDIDFFKKVNDSLGHVVGSGVLTQMGVVLKNLIRNSDYAFRYGGDEFIILLGHTEGEDAFNVAERIRNKVENHQFNVNSILVNITVSIGLAFYPKHASSAEEIVRIADEAMYYGKNKSRNIVYKAG